MSALTEQRNTKRFGESFPSVNFYPVKGGAKIFKGSLVVLESGKAKPGVSATGLVCAGRAASTVDNSVGGDGDLTIEVDQGVFNWDGVGVSSSEVGSKVYVVDDHTVSSVSTGKSLAGTVYLVDSNGVWVLMYLGAN